MSEAKTKVFIVGERAYGLVIVSFDPYHVIRVSKEVIEQYADTYFQGIPDGYNRTFNLLGRSVLSMVTDLSDHGPAGNIDKYQEAYLDLFNHRKFNLSNAEFCVVGMIDPARHDQHLDEQDHPSGGLEGRRKSHSMLHQAIDKLLEDDSMEPTDIDLEEDNRMRPVGDDPGHDDGQDGDHDHDHEH